MYICSFPNGFLSICSLVKKVQTIKDLEKPWSFLASVGSAHSAKTTLLLDDSVKKAVLQPYNHVCIREYTQVLRNIDNQALALEPPAPLAEEVTVENLQDVELNMETKEDTRKRRRKEKKARKLAERQAALQAAVDTDMSTRPKVDETILAVIGILHAARRQDNVAGWVYAGGLWGPFPSSADRPGGIRGSAVVEQEEEQERQAADVGEEGESRADKPDIPLWFESEKVLEYWAAKGRKAVGKLGIEAKHGLPAP